MDIQSSSMIQITHTSIYFPHVELIHIIDDLYISSVIYKYLRSEAPEVFSTLRLGQNPSRDVPEQMLRCNLNESQQNFPSVQDNRNISNILLSITNRDVETAAVIKRCELLSNNKLHFSDIDGITLDILQEEIGKKGIFQHRNNPFYLRYIKKKIRIHIIRMNKYKESMEIEQDNNYSPYVDKSDMSSNSDYSSDSEVLSTDSSADELSKSGDSSYPLTEKISTTL